MNETITTCASSTDFIVTSNSTSTNYWIYNDGTTLHVTEDPLEHMRMQFDELMENFFEDRENREADPGHVPYFSAVTTRVGREMMLTDQFE